jgi:hypothetical protein
VARFGEGPNGLRLLTGDLENFVVEKIYTPEFKHLEGMTLQDAGSKMHAHIVDTMLAIAIADELRTVFNAPPPHTRVALLKEIVNYPGPIVENVRFRGAFYLGVCSSALPLWAAI